MQKIARDDTRQDASTVREEVEENDEENDGDRDIGAKSKDEKAVGNNAIDDNNTDSSRNKGYNNDTNDGANDGNNSSSSNNNNNGHGNNSNNDNKCSCNCHSKRERYNTDKKGLVYAFIMDGKSTDPKKTIDNLNKLYKERLKDSVDFYLCEAPKEAQIEAILGSLNGSSGDEYSSITLIFNAHGSGDKDNSDNDYIRVYDGNGGKTKIYVKKLLSLLYDGLDKWAGKPKILIVDSCRGKEGSPPPDTFVAMATGSTACDDPEFLDSEIRGNDCVVVRTCLPGMESLWRESEGSVFLNYFTKVALKDPTTCVLEVIKLAKNEVVKCRRYKPPVAIFSSTLTFTFSYERPRVQRTSVPSLTSTSSQTSAASPQSESPSPVSTPSPTTSLSPSLTTNNHLYFANHITVNHNVISEHQQSGLGSRVVESGGGGPQVDNGYYFAVAAVVFLFIGMAIRLLLNHS